MDRTIEDFVRGLALDAYLVGGAVRDELLGLESKDADFVVPGVDYDGLRRALEPHGKVEDFEGAGRTEERTSDSRSRAGVGPPASIRGTHASVQPRRRASSSPRRGPSAAPG